MGRMLWRRSLHLLHRSLARPAHGPPRPAAPFAEEAHGESALWTQSTRAAHFFSWERCSVVGLGLLQSTPGCSQGCGLSFGEELRAGTGRRSFHATGTQHMAGKNFYETLGLQQGASQKDIKNAYYALAKKWHPDVNKGNPEAEKKFQEVSQAYEVLKDDEKRAMYDQVGHDSYEQAAAGGAPGGGAGFEGFSETIFGDAFGENMDEVFNRVFGGRDQGRLNVQLNLELTFREAVQGCTKVVNFTTAVRCKSCNGSGLPPGVQPQTCKKCKGRGRVVMQQAFFSFESTCSACGGSGHTVKDRCRTCEGAGVVMGNREVRVNIPAGVESGTTLNVTGEGGEGAKGVRPGNLLLTLLVKLDKVFKREGSDIYVDVSIPFTQAILGGSVQVPTLTGDVLLKVRAGIQPGQKQVLRGKGVKVLNSRRYGDQYVQINVVIPTDLSQRQRQLIEEFAREESGEVETAAAEGSG